MKSLFAILCFLSLQGFSQDTSILNCWKKAVVNLEVRTDDTTGYDKYLLHRKKLVDSLEKLEKSGRISSSDFSKIYFKDQDSIMGNRKSIFTGTAIFVKKENRRYLITARHMLQNSITSDFRLMYKMDSIFDFDRIYDDIFVVPNYDYVVNDTSTNWPSLYVNDAPVPMRVKPFGFTAFSFDINTKKECYPYTFSHQLDIGILSLDSKYAIFGGKTFNSLGDYLESIGYQPIMYSSIGDEPSFEGAELFTVGYPGATSVIEQYNLSKDEFSVSASSNSLPIFSFGKVAMLDDKLPLFWADMSIYPGNSGGPIVESKKLVGIISSQAVVERNRIPFGAVIKAKYIKELINIQESKDNCMGK